MHRFNGDQLCAPGVCHFLREESRRDDSGHLAAVGQNGVGDQAHEADRSTAVDEADSPTSQQLAQFCCGLDDRFVGAEG